MKSADTVTDRLLGWLRIFGNEGTYEETQDPEFPLDFDTHPISVMISSPVDVANGLRVQIKKAMSEVTGVDTLLFEHLLDSGESNVNESLLNVEKCHLFYAIFDPSVAGTTIPPKHVPKEYLKEKRLWKYSELELAAVKKRKKKGEIPKIFIYVVGERGKVSFTDPQDSSVNGLDWRDKALEERAATGYGTESEAKKIAEDIRANIVSHALVWRSGRSRYLSQQVTKFEMDLKSSNEKHDLFKEHHSKFVEEIKNNYKESVKSVQSLYDSELERSKILQDQLHKIVRRGAFYMAFGVLIGIVSWLIFHLTLSFVRSDTPSYGKEVEQIASSIQRGSELVASSNMVKPLFVNNIEIDPMLIAAKINIAQKLTNRKFDCEMEKDPIVSVLSPSKARPMVILKDSVCNGYGALMIEQQVSGFDNCEYKPIIEVASWEQFFSIVRFQTNIGIDKITLIGHASDDQISGDCEEVSDKILQFNKSRGDLNVLKPTDRLIKTNTQLAYARSAAMAVLIEEAAEKESPEIKVQPETLGLYGVSGNDGKDRRVTIAITLNQIHEKVLKE